MNYKRFLIAFLAGGVVMNVLDQITHGLILKSTYEANSALFNSADSTSPALYIIAAFIASAIFVWVYAKVIDSVGAGPKGGLLFGIYAGILISFPGMLYMHIMIAGFPYYLSWVWILNTIVVYAIAGAVVGQLYQKPEATV